MGHTLNLILEAAYGLLGIALVVSPGLRRLTARSARQIVRGFGQSVEALLSQPMWPFTRGREPALPRFDPYRANPISVEWLVELLMANRIDWIQFELRMDQLFGMWRDQNVEDEEWDPLGPVVLRGSWKWEGDTLTWVDSTPTPESAYRVPSHQLGSRMDQGADWLGAGEATKRALELAQKGKLAKAEQIYQRAVTAANPDAQVIEVLGGGDHEVLVRVSLDGRVFDCRPREQYKVPIVGTKRMAGYRPPPPPKPPPKPADAARSATPPR